MILFFDTETTGLPKNWNAPITDINNWPRLVQIAFAYYTDEGLFIGSYNFIVKPDGYSIPSEVSNIHGITTERANREGVELNRILDEFELAVKISSIIVAHNMEFDETIIGCEFYRMGRSNPLEAKSKFCTMKNPEVVNFCAIPPFKYGAFKWPSLSELHGKLFYSDFEEAHNAEFDVKATANCFWELKKRGVISLQLFDSGNNNGERNVNDEKIAINIKSNFISGTKKEYTDGTFEIIRPIPDERLQVAWADFDKRMNWLEASKACRELGAGWRLPTISELDFIYKKLHLSRKGNFHDDKYWSSTEYTSYEKPWAYISDFHDMCPMELQMSPKEDYFRVRAVRTNLIVKCPRLGYSLQVALKDFNGIMQQMEAVRACQELGEGWRLPTKSELDLIYKELHQAGKGDFNNGTYWSYDTEYDEYGYPNGSAQNFRTGEQWAENFLSFLFVRAVRTI